ncbi:MAG TPA: SpoIID/LytB domain-containing protein [Vicinamibacterales bacterium]|nr:SpoIID/LytB domain-containing protein [Vicinamibacterales bacterium]
MKTVLMAVLLVLAPALLAQDSAPVISVPATVRVGVQRGSSYEVTALPLETYVARVLAGEAAPQSPAAAMEALAVTVRTFALANLGRHRADGFDLCDQTHCQVLRPSTPATERAAQATAGQVLLYRGELASVFFSASCGGFTERPSDVWPGADNPAYLPARRDDACEGEPAWGDDISRTDLARALASAGFRGVFREARITDRDSSGRVARIALDGLNPGEISGQDLRMAVSRTLGVQHVKSALFELRRSGETFHFSGHGFGHGVGLCVTGSVKLAAQGDTASAILSRYFPGTVIAAPTARTTDARQARPPLPVARPPAALPVAISLPDEDAGEEEALAQLFVRARADLEGALGASLTRRVTFRFHATTDDYEHSTGQQWFTSAAVVNGEIHFVPLASLRDRGILDRTIRRELVHLVVDEPLASRPAWVRDGAALYFSDARRAPETARTICPNDIELQRPISPGALADAYARARACFARQIEAGRAWKDIR